MPGSVCFMNYLASNLRGATRQVQFVAGKRDTIAEPAPPCLVHLSISFSPHPVIADLIDDQLSLALFSGIGSLVVSDLKRKLVSRANIAAVAQANAGFKMIEDFDKTHKIAHSSEYTPRLLYQ